MKPSIYNHFISINGDKVICYNAYTDSFLVSTKHNVDTFKKTIDFSSAIGRQFIENGFWIKDNLNEKQTFIEERTKDIYAIDSYRLFINPTMDCNLKCWYCYENHIENSFLNEELILAIEKHIELKYQEIKFKELILSFFGGEPLLCIEIVEKLISIAKSLEKKYKFKLFISFTTNATLITDDFLEKLTSENTSFQITLDGNETCHDKIRKLKSSGEGTYKKILNSVDSIFKILKDKTSVIFRINMSVATVNNMEMILDDIKKFSTYSNFIVSLHKVWQVNDDTINEKKVLAFVSKCQSLGIKCEYLALQQCFCSCYADYKNEVIINYDGFVFKCTARPFTKENSYGRLDLDGKIIWNNELLNKRLSLPLPPKCLDCNILPSCPKYCSQKLMENETKSCPINENYSVNDYIIHNFNNYLIDYKKSLKTI